jgi:V/A-type H+-transporting ATPase subunit E
MGYQTLIETLLKEGESKSREVVEKARKEAEAIVHEAEGEANRLEQESQQSIEKEVQTRKTKILNQARLQYRQSLLKAKHEVLEKVFKKVEERLQSQLIKGGSEDFHHRFWIRLVEESLSKNKPKDLRAILHDEAPVALERSLREKGIPCERVRDPDLWLGFKLVTAGNQVALINSYKARLEKVQPDLLVALNALLFGKAKGEG